MNTSIIKPVPGEYAEVYNYYIGLVPTAELINELNLQLADFKVFISNIPEDKMGYSYATGKWNIAQIIQHILDTERIYVFRMLNFVRGGWMEIPGFDQDVFAQNADVTQRSKQSFIDEFDAIRRSTIAFLATITTEQSCIIGKANNNKISVRAMGYVAYGHIAHHCKVITEKYL